MKNMKTQLFPMIQFKKDTWEIDEFECASIFVLVGEEKAMVIDSGFGIGDLLGAIRTRITDKPLIVVATHGDGDHIGGMEHFEEYYMDENDWDAPEQPSMQMRRGDALYIAERQGRSYPYDADRDITPWVKHPKRLKLTPYMEFDLGGGRIIKSYPCPGHSAGQVAFLDASTRSLFCGDAVNVNLGLGGGLSGTNTKVTHRSTSIERALEGLELLSSLGDQYDGIYNGHHDYRPFGAPLSDDVLPDAIDLCKQLVSGQYNVVYTANPLRLPGRPKMRACVKKGNVEVTFNPNAIHEATMREILAKESNQ